MIRSEQELVRASKRIDRIDHAITGWMARHSVLLLRLSMGLVFIWFGAIKLIPGMSPAADLAVRTIEVLTFGLAPPQAGLVVLAVWEVAIGVGFVAGAFTRLTLFLLFLQMLGTLTPLVLFPAETWKAFPMSPTLEGQYIIKNAVLVSAGLVIGATVRGGRIVNPK